jgi:hypothetical protein
MKLKEFEKKFGPLSVISTYAVATLACNNLNNINPESTGVWIPVSIIGAGVVYWLIGRDWGGHRGESNTSRSPDNGTSVEAWQLARELFRRESRDCEFGYGSGELVQRYGEGSSVKSISGLLGEIVINDQGQFGSHSFAIVRGGVWYDNKGKPLSVQVITGAEIAEKGLNESQVRPAVDKDGQNGLTSDSRTMVQKMVDNDPSGMAMLEVDVAVAKEKPWGMLGRKTEELRQVSWLDTARSRANANLEAEIRNIRGQTEIHLANNDILYRDSGETNFGTFGARRNIR